MHTPSIHQTRLLVHTSPDIEPRRGHILVQIPPGPPFPELDPLIVGLENFLHDLLEGYTILQIESGRGVIIWEEFSNFCVKDFVAIRSEETVVLDALKPPPRSVATVVARIDSTTQEVGDKAVTNTGSKRENGGPVPIKVYCVT